MADPANTLCAELPGASVSQPFGEDHDVWKVGEKIFAAVTEGLGAVSVKTADVETATMLIDAGAGTKAPYFHKSWIRIQTDAKDMPHRVHASYDLIRSKLPAKTRNALPSRKDL